MNAPLTKVYAFDRGSQVNTPLIELYAFGRVLGERAFNYIICNRYGFTNEYALNHILCNR